MPTNSSTRPLEAALERSVYVVHVEFHDETGALVTPTSATWTLTRKSGDSSTVVNSRSAVPISPIAEAVDIVLSGADLAYTRHNPMRFFLVEYVYNSSNGSGLVGREERAFPITNLTGVS